MGVRSAGKNRQGHVVIPVVFPLKTDVYKRQKKEDIEVRDVTEEWNARWMKKKKYKEVLL